MCRCNFHLWTFSNHEAFLEVIDIVNGENKIIPVHDIRFCPEEYAKSSGPTGMVLVPVKYLDAKIEHDRDRFPYDDLLRFAGEGKIQVNELPFHNWKSFKAVVDFIAKKKITDVFGVVQIEI